MLRVLRRLRPRSLPLPAPLLPPPSPSLLSCSFSSTRRRRAAGDGGDDNADDDGKVPGLFVLHRPPGQPPRLLVVQPRLRDEAALDAKLDEALSLAASLEEPRDGFYETDITKRPAPLHVIVQNPVARSGRAHADTYFGPGTVDNIKCHLRGLEEKNEVDAVYVNAILSGIQQRNLEVAFGKPVLDRVGLIIEIFNAHAETKEAKLQSELAALMYKKTRLVRVRGPGGRLTFGPSGEAEVVSARGRASGGRGFISGAGETELQLQRRRIQERRIKLLAQIEEVHRTRALQRSARKRYGGSSGGLATVAVVGYTNAGKSTLVNALTHADLFSDPRLFATVDPRLRSVILPSGRKAILSDTVGFISNLPVQLVEAFHATLEEVVEADLLVHVVDCTAPNLEEHRSSVLQVLQQIGVSEDKLKDMIEVWNKIDILDVDAKSDTVQDEDIEADMVRDNETEADVVQDDGTEADMVEDGLITAGGESEEIKELSDDSDVFSSDSEKSSNKTLVEDMTDFEQASHSSFNSSEEQQPNGLVCSVKSELAATCHVRTSALTGVGLQELLNLMDEKLTESKNVIGRSFTPLDRKWRPSDAELAGQAAEQ